MNGLTTDEIAWEAIKPILKVGFTRGFYDEDAWFLMQFFEIEDDTVEVKPASIRMEEIGRRRIKSRESLTLLAIALKRDPQTVRRWCKAGLVPGAYKTKEGGHWRAPFNKSTIRTVAERVGGWSRASKGVLNSRRWKEFKARNFPIFVRVIPTLFKLDAELRHASDLLAKPTADVSDRSLMKLLEIRKAGGTDACDFLNLRLTARDLHLKAQPVTAAAIAMRLGVSRRTLFRKFPGGRVRSVIRDAARPIDSNSDQGSTTRSDADIDREYVEEITSRTERPARASKSNSSASKHR